MSRHTCNYRLHKAQLTCLAPQCYQSLMTFAYYCKLIYRRFTRLSMLLLVAMHQVRGMCSESGTGDARACMIQWHDVALTSLTAHPVGLALSARSSSATVQVTVRFCVLLFFHSAYCLIASCEAHGHEVYAVC
jgi:hypothetical protein